MSLALTGSLPLRHSIDSDLNGVPDILEDISLATSTPFLGRPFVITGCIEAEQFDSGGKGVAYTNVAANTCTNGYRASAMAITTNVNERGGGYAVDKLRAGEWLNYTIDVRVGQTYVVEPRVAAASTGGVFRFDFYTNGVPYTNTAPMVVTSTNWTSITSPMLRLAPGTNIMRLVLLTNGADGSYVGKFNYTSIYPAWNEGVTNIVWTNAVSGLTADSGNNWFTASNNAALIQAKIDDLTNHLSSGQGGVVDLPAGRYYVTQKIPDESKDAQYNAALFVTLDNVVIRGTGPTKTNTALIAFNRATTILHHGWNPYSKALMQRANMTLTTLVLEGRPHWVSVTNNSSAGGFTNYWEQGSFVPPGSPQNYEGYTLLCGGPDVSHYNNNISFSNCVFKNPTSASIGLPYQASNVVVRSCDFVHHDGTNGTFPLPHGITNTNDPNTMAGLYGEVGIYLRFPGGYNVVVLDSTFNGHPGLTNVNTTYEYDAADGLFLGQTAGNWFIGRCFLTNYGLEAIQCNDGPAAAVGNEFHSIISTASTCALLADGPTGYSTPTGSGVDRSYYLVGNVVDGGRLGHRAITSETNGLGPFQIHVCGNSLSFLPAFDRSDDFPSAAIGALNAGFCNLSGNTLLRGGMGVRLLDGSTNAVILKNDFGAADYRGLLWQMTTGAVQHVTAARNVLGRGVGYHLKIVNADAANFFAIENVYTNGVTSVPPFTDPASAPVHFYNY